MPNLQGAANASPDAWRRAAELATLDRLESAMSFRTNHLRRLGSSVKVSVPTDSEGYLGRECPQSDCEGYFKIKPGTGLTGPGLTCTCPYCGHTGSPDQFWTRDQVEYAKSVAFRQVSQALTKDLKSLEFNHRPRGSFGIGLSLKVKAGSLPPLRRYREQALETALSCAACTLEYAVFGVFAHCPDCRVHNSLQILGRNVELVRKQVTLALSLEDDELQRHLLEDALENCVSSFDGFGRECCRVRALHSTDAARCSKATFQNIAKADYTLRQLFGIDLRSNIDSAEWQQAHRAFMRRHVITHRAGVVDQQYLTETGDSPALLGRKVPVESAEILGAAAVVLKIGEAMVRALPNP